MRPDEYKQSQSRKYQAKLRSRDSEASKEIQEKRKERSSKSRGGLQNKSGDKEYKETEEIGEENDKPKRQSFRKRKVESNSYRYKDISDTEETRSFDPSIYFQFKEEKDWDTSVDASVNEDEEKQETNVDSSLYTTGPIVPKTVRNIPIVPQKFISKNVKPIEIPTSVQSSTSNNIIKEPQSKKTIEIDLGKKIVANNASQGISGTSASTNKKPISHSLISNKDDDDIDDFLKSLDEENAKQIKPTSSLPNNKRGTKKISINLKNQNKITAGKNDDDTEDWLDDILK
ncbi:hypothetical protein RhiirA1_387352 [Rhizophagus irregularis]|uniref:Uncharacterized protein n=1 Tax=Rhizophagus irregularis TaxID=588596 RepID=A0A2I1DSD5_9GLOM|nr:hypothetical protein RhiirA1_387352 [Rhizophagus irregularis]PKY12781.1 hypothetical protein RhiirB3_378739 [Rhizophagus irregularis]